MVRRGVEGLSSHSRTALCHQSHIIDKTDTDIVVGPIKVKKQVKPKKQTRPKKIAAKKATAGKKKVTRKPVTRQSLKEKL